MSSLTVEQVRELTERINERLAEFDVEGSRVFEWVTPGVTRLVFGVVEEWQAHQAATKHLAYESVIDEGKPVDRDDGFAEFEAFWPAMPDLQGGFDALLASPRRKETEQGSEQTSKGADLFAEHPVAGLPEPITQEVITHPEPPLIAPLPELMPIAPPPTNGHHADELELSTATVVTVGAAHTGGNGIRHHAEPSPATTATLGPEHTVVTPLIPRRPRTLAEVDGIDDDETNSRPTRAKLPVVTREQLIAELKRQAMAGAMPTRPAFDLAKPAVWPMSQMLLKRFDTTWANLADEAGLRLVRS